MRPTAWAMATEMFQRIYTTHPGTEPEAFEAASEATEPFQGAVREEIWRASCDTHPQGQDREDGLGS